MIPIDKETLEADELVVGGGIAGLMAAINAAGQGARVIVVEKAYTKRSGSGATGNDHFVCYIPDVHGRDMDPIVKEVRKGAANPLVIVSRADPQFLSKLFEIEIPEIYDGIIEIKGVAREAGERSKVTV